MGRHQHDETSMADPYPQLVGTDDGDQAALGCKGCKGIAQVCEVVVEPGNDELQDPWDAWITGVPHFLQSRRAVVSLREEVGPCCFHLWVEIGCRAHAQSDGVAAAGHVSVRKSSTSMLKRK